VPTFILKIAQKAIDFKWKSREIPC